MNNFEKAIEIIGNRRTDTKLVSVATALLGADLPDMTNTAKVPVCIAPHVAGGTNAEREFFELANFSGGLPMWTTYREDTFTISNAAKVNHWRPKIAWPKGQLTKQWIVGVENRRNMTKGIGKAATIFENDGRPTIVEEYQRQLATLAFKVDSESALPPMEDYSAWYTRQSARRGTERSAVGYYPAVMALYSVFGVMFRYDNQPGEASILEFRKTVSGPAAEISKDVLGVGPVIVSLNYPPAGAVTDLSHLTAAQTNQMQKYGTIETGIV